MTQKLENGGNTAIIYTSTVAPIINYASVIWASNATKSVLSKLDTIQRITAQAIIGGFKTVALHTIEFEANLQSVQKRFHRHELRI